MKKSAFIPGETYIPASGKVFGRAEIRNGIAAVRDGWWTEGRFAAEFERRFASVVGAKSVTLTNSGSSANLLAISALTSPVLGSRALAPGDEVITAAAGFPTTVNPIVQNNCIPVFVDSDLSTKNPTAAAIEAAVTPKTKAIMLAHTLGNPLPVAAITAIARKYGLWFIEDACDALGSTYGGRPVGSFGDIATFSFYPAHQITMGEGGAAVTSNPLLHRAIRQFRDWGRDCWCDTGHDDTCGRRFSWQMGDLPLGYDHKYVYSRIGYNLKLTDMQAAIGLAQLERLPVFAARRRANFEAYRRFFSRYSRYFLLTEPEEGSAPCWFGFMLVVKPDAPFTRLSLVKYLEDHRVGTRNLFAGNITRHLAYRDRTDIRKAGPLTTADMLMNNGFWIGVYPGVTPAMRRYVMSVVERFLADYTPADVSAGRIPSRRSPGRRTTSA